MSMSALTWSVPPSSLPLRLVIVRLLEAENKPVHMVELESELTRLGIKFTHKSMLQRLHELVTGAALAGYRPVYRVGRATYATRPAYRMGPASRAKRRRS